MKLSICDVHISPLSTWFRETPLKLTVIQTYPGITRFNKIPDQLKEKINEQIIQTGQHLSIHQYVIPNKIFETLHFNSPSLKDISNEHIIQSMKTGKNNITLFRDKHGQELIGNISFRRNSISFYYEKTLTITLEFNSLKNFNNTEIYSDSSPLLKRKANDFDSELKIVLKKNYANNWFPSDPMVNIQDINYTVKNKFSIKKELNILSY